MVEDQYIAQLEKHYQLHLRRLVMDQQFEAIVLFGGKKRPETTKELHERVRLFQAKEKRSTSYGWLIEWEEWNSKKLGKQQWPSKITVPSEQDLTSLLDKESELNTFKIQLKEILQWNEHMRPWLADQPQQVLNLKPVWTEIREVLTFLLAHDVRGLYLRSLPVPVHTKFIERHERLLLSILKCLTPEVIAPDETSIEKGLSMAQKPLLHQARWLDCQLAEKYTYGMEVIGLSPQEMKKLPWELEAICIVENEINLYLLPPTTGMLSIFGWGKALSLLREIPILQRSRLFYWGDLDEDGFSMLNNLRAHYPHTQSLFMDEDAVFTHEKEMLLQPARYLHRVLPLLTASENAAYQKLAALNGRIEQEKLQQKYIQETLAAFL